MGKKTFVSKFIRRLCYLTSSDPSTVRHNRKSRLEKIKSSNFIGDFTYNLGNFNTNIRRTCVHRFVTR